MAKKATNKKVSADKPATQLELFSVKVELEAKIEKVEANLMNEMNNRFDQIMKELERAREDRHFAVAKDRDQDSKIENLDKRVKLLETAEV